MLHNLGLALRMKYLHNVSELVVSRNVFCEVLRRHHDPGQSGRLRLNQPHDSFAYRFMHHVHWQGILFIHFSHKALRRNLERVRF